MKTTWQVGEVTITKVVELETLGGTRFLLPQATPDEVLRIKWLHPCFADERGKLRMSIHALVIQAPSLCIVVDPCIGNDKTGRRVPDWNQRQGRFLQDFAAAGFDRAQVNAVVCTHLHVDHVGWNTMMEDGRWVPTFPNARYLFTRAEYEHWSREGKDAQAAAILDDSIRPVIDAGLVDLVATDHRLCGEISLIPTPGHTPGHVSIAIRSLGRSALITGDFLHHPCQMHHPHWNSLADTDPEAAQATRRQMLESLADADTLVIGTHFAAPTAGHVARDGPRYRFDVRRTSEDANKETSA